MTVHASGTPIKLSEITAEFGGSDMNSQKGKTWYGSTVLAIIRL